MPRRQRISGFAAGMKRSRQDISSSDSESDLELSLETPLASFDGLVLYEPDSLNIVEPCSEESVPDEVSSPLYSDNDEDNDLNMQNMNFDFVYDVDISLRRSGNFARRKS